MTDPEPTPYEPPPPAYPLAGPKRLTRSRDDRMIAGVCGGVARYLNIDVTLIRVLMVVALVVGFFAPGVLYVVAWALMPQE